MGTSATISPHFAVEGVHRNAGDGPPRAAALLPCIQNGELRAPSMSPLFCSLLLEPATTVCGAQEERLLMGMQSSSLTAGVAYNLHAPSFYKPHSVSLHIILPSVGRETIFRMLDSLEPQLKDQVRPAECGMPAAQQESAPSASSGVLRETPGRGAHFFNIQHPALTAGLCHRGLRRTGQARCVREGAGGACPHAR